MLTSNVILTAGHCVTKVGDKVGKGEVTEVTLIAVFNTDLNSAQRGDVRLITQTVVHPQYGKTTGNTDNHDLAIVKFAGALPAGYQLAKFLDDESLLKEGTTVTLAGFGINKTDGTNTESDNRLSKVDIEVAVPDFGQHEVILDQRNGKGACHGDSGGPAFLER